MSSLHNSKGPTMGIEPLLDSLIVMGTFVSQRTLDTVSPGNDYLEIFMSAA